MSAVTFVQLDYRAARAAHAAVDATRADATRAAGAEADAGIAPRGAEADEGLSRSNTVIILFGK